MAEPALVEIYEGIKVSPRVRMAAMLYASGAVKTKGAAARAAGITKEYFVNMSNLNPETRRIIGDVQSMILDETISTSAIVQKLGRRAVGRLAELMDSPNDAVAFRAAQDLADRAPETQKTQKFQMDMLTITGEDAKAIAAAMVESASGQEKFKHVATEGLVEVDFEQHDAVIPQLKLIRGDVSGEEEQGSQGREANDADAPQGS